jgi:hydroxymethylpyrimidine pyrophosphatase-like HAD family hydrolase
MNNKIIACDFDGTLCKNRFPLIGDPNNEVIENIKLEKATGSKIILWTCRTGKDLSEAIEWCKSKHGLIFDAVNENLQENIDLFGGDTRKIFADEYWDDKAVKVGSL